MPNLKMKIWGWISSVGLNSDWAHRMNDVDMSIEDMSEEEKSNLFLKLPDLIKLAVKFGPHKIIYHINQLFNNQTFCSSQPYPFGKYHDASRYIQDSILSVPESGVLDLIEPCHEFKAFIYTPDEKKLEKFITDVIRFAAACMNSRTNGTIHFGIIDKPHGLIVGVTVDDKEKYLKYLKSAIDSYFEDKHRDAAHKCIKTPRFVEVLNRNRTSSNKFVIEVDIEPRSAICGENIYQIVKMKHKNSTENKFFIRDGATSSNLFPRTPSAKLMEKYKKFVRKIPELSQQRKNAEERHFKPIKRTTQGSRLINMITGGAFSMDKSNFEHYVIVTNKSHPIHFENLEFLKELKPVAVLDFDPESAKSGLSSYFKQQIRMNPHLLAKYERMDNNNSVQLELFKDTNWVFCNGGIEEEEPSEVDQWLIQKGASIRDVISFLCRREELNKRFLVIFLLLSTVREEMDPLVETFSMFLQELGGSGQILCICDGENTFNSWRDLIEAKCRFDISDRCISELSLAEVNGTVLSLWSENRRAKRFLPCGGESNVGLERKVEQTWNTLEILCVNQCEGGNEDRVSIEENFYRGGKVSWWNFHFSELPGSIPFIKRDQFDYIVNTIIPDLCSLTKPCVLFNLLHLPGCGGTTLAMHVLWALRDKYRCAVLREKSDFKNLADHVIELLMYQYDEQTPRVPVLLMIDDFEDMEKVEELQSAIEQQIIEKDIQGAKVILLNCMRSESSAVTGLTPDTVFIRNNLSDEELRYRKRTPE